MLHNELVVDYFRAAYCHRFIVADHKHAEYRLLLDKTPTSLQEAMLAIAAIEEDKVEGLLEIRPGKIIPAWSLLKVLTNMVASFVTRSIQSALHRRKQLGTLESAEEVYPGLTAKLYKAYGLLDALVEVDERWVVLEDVHRDRLAAGLTEAQSMLTEGERATLPPHDLARALAWAN